MLDTSDVPKRMISEGWGGGHCLETVLIVVTGRGGDPGIDQVESRNAGKYNTQHSQQNQMLQHLKRQ